MTTAITVVVPVSDDAKFHDHLLASPGLGEIAAAVIPVRDARSAAEAFHAGAARSLSGWVLYCHQDVYFPAGSGHKLQAILMEIPPGEERSTILGFIGLDRDGKLVGLVDDRGRLLSGPECAAAVSIDELAVVLHRDSTYRLDPALGWHLWATDLCLQALSLRTPARVVRVPVSHNSTSGYGLPPAFAASAQVLFKKHPQRQSIATLNGTLRR